MAERGKKVAAVAAAAKQRVDAKLGHIWWAILLRGLLAVALAVCAFVWPQKTVTIFVKLLGVYFLIDGLIGAVGAYRSGDKTGPMLQSIVSLAIGIILLAWTGVTEKLFLILVGIWLLLQGVSLLLSAFRMDSTDPERRLAMVIGGVMGLIGVVFVVWPSTGVVAISWLIGIAAAVIGGLLIFLATKVKGLQHKMDALGDCVN